MVQLKSNIFNMSNVRADFVITTACKTLALVDLIRLIVIKNLYTLPYSCM